MTRKISLILFLILLGFGQLRGQGRGGISLGATASPKGVGADVIFSGNGATSHLRLSADLESVISGKCKLPGTRLEYYMEFPLLSKSLSRESSFEILAGPGAVAGFLKDNGRGFGPVLGAGAQAAAAFHLGRGVGARISLGAALAIHCEKKTEYQTTVRIWKNGYERAFWPEISILYSF